MTLLFDIHPKDDFFFFRQNLYYKIIDRLSVNIKNKLYFESQIAHLLGFILSHRF